MKNEISVVILGNNSEDKIEILYRSLRYFDEIIYIDDYSTDKSEELCKRFGIKYFKRHLESDFADQRNFALERSKHDWVFFLDSDEEIDENLVKEAINKVKNEKYDGYYIKRNDVFLGHVMKGTEMGNDKVLRLGKKSKGKWVRKVHEYWNIKGPTGILDVPLIHNTAISLNGFISKINFYYRIHSIENTRLGKKSTLIKIIFFTPSKFFYNFIILKGYKDYTFGFVVSVLMSFHTFLSWSESWLNDRK